MVLSQATVFDKIALYTNETVTFCDIESIRRVDEKTFCITIFLNNKTHPLTFTKFAFDKAFKSIDGVYYRVCACTEKEVGSNKEIETLKQRFSSVEKKIAKYSKRYGYNTNQPEIGGDRAEDQKHDGFLQSE